jgi:hypothetical protein
MIARREVPHPGAQLTFTDVDGHRHQVFDTDFADTDIARLETPYRGRGRDGRQICDAKGIRTVTVQAVARWTRIGPAKRCSPADTDSGQFADRRVGSTSEQSEVGVLESELRRPALALAGVPDLDASQVVHRCVGERNVACQRDLPRPHPERVEAVTAS